MCLEAVTDGSCVYHPEVETLLGEITDVAAISLHFDPSLLVFCWRSVGRLACGATSSQLQQHSSIVTIIEQLCIAIATITSQSVSGDPFLEKKLKCGHFLCSLLFRLISQFPQVKLECSVPSLNLLLDVHQTLYSVEDHALFLRLEANVLLLRDSLVECMCEEERFLSLLLAPSNLSSGQHYGWALCLAALLRTFPFLSVPVQEYCLETSTSKEEGSSTCRILDAVFSCVESCHDLELLLVSSGKTSAYHVLCSHLCSFLVQLPSHFISQVELNILVHLLRPQLYSSLLASDVLLYLVRSGGDEVIGRYCQVLIELLQPLLRSGPSHSWTTLLLISLLNRALSLLPVGSQVGFFPADHKDCLWTALNAYSLHSEVFRELGPQLVANSIGFLSRQEISQSFEGAGPSLHCLCAVACASPSVVKGHVPTLLQLILTPHKPHTHELCLCLSSCILSVSSATELSKVFSHIAVLATSEELTLSVALALCYFLSNCSSIHFHLSVEGVALEILGRCYHALLPCHHWLVQQHALEALRKFAEVTPHPNAVEPCIPTHLTDLVVTYLRKIPFRGEVFQDKLSKCLQLSHLHQPLKSLQCALSRSEAALQALREAWEKVEGIGSLSSASLNQLVSINEQIASFLSTFELQTH